MYGLPLGFPVAFVPHYVLQVFVTLYIVAANDVGSLSYDLLWQSGLPCYLYGKRAARATYGQLEQGFHLVAVV